MTNESTASKSEEKLGKHSRQLKNFLIHPRFQLSLAFMNTFILLGGLGAVYYQVITSFKDLDQVVKVKKLVISPFYTELISYQENFIVTTIVMTAILCTVLIVLFSIIFSHKTSGAVYGLKKYFQDIADNGYERPLVFRDSDLHPEIPDSVNSAIERIKKDLQK